MPVAKTSVALRRRRSLHSLFLLLFLVSTAPIFAQSTVNVRIMAANLNGSTQSYQPFALRILQGTRADVVAIQEFNYNNNTAYDFRSFVDTCFGTNYVYYREPYTAGGDIPNGIISRYPILNSGSWVDTQMSSPNRGFAWAQIDLPGTNNLYVVSVHLLTTSSTVRASEAAALKNLIQTNFPTNAWVVIAGDFNTDSQTEAAMVTFDSFLSDNPIPADNNGNSYTSQNRNHPHDYVLPSFSLTNCETASVFASHSFPNGLVFDSTVYTPLSDVTPVQLSDSTNAQHMAVMKDFLVATNDNTSTAPSISVQPQTQTVPPGSNVTFSVTASGTAPLSYKWLFNTTNVVSTLTNSYSIPNAQPTNAGAYSVIITNTFGSITSSVAMLTVTNAPTVNTGAVVTLAGWDVSAQANYGTSPLPPTTNAPGIIVGGLTRDGGVATAGTAAARTWGGNGFDATSEANAIAAADYVTFSFTNTPGFSVSYTAISQYDYKRSSSGPPNGVLQYQIGSGAFTDIATFAYTSTSGASLGPIDLSGVSALQNATNPVTFRIVNYGATSSGGNWYIYDLSNNTAPDFAVQGILNAIAPNPPAAAAVLGSPLTASGNQFQFTVTGTAGSNYIVQVSTNLTASNWISVFTNASPFTFTDTNVNTSAQRFFRAVVP